MSHCKCIKEDTLSSTIPFIKQNEKSNFTIVKGNWPYSVDVLFDHTEFLIIQNLFKILKSYTFKEEYLINFFLIISFDSENEINIKRLHYIDFYKIKNFSFFEFKEFFTKLYDNDFHYIKTEKYYGFRIVFFKESFFWKNEIVFPSFSWKDPLLKFEILDNYKNQKDNILIQKLKAENTLLKKKLYKKRKSPIVCQ